MHDVLFKNAYSGLAFDILLESEAHPPPTGCAVR